MGVTCSRGRFLVLSNDPCLNLCKLSFFWGGEGRFDFKSWTADVEVHEFASYMKYSMSAMLRWCMQNYWRNSLYRRALIFLFKIQMTQYCSIPLSCSGSSSGNFLPAFFHHDCLREGQLLFIGSEFLTTFKNLPHFMKNPKVHYRVHNSSPPDPILIVISPLNALP